MAHLCATWTAVNPTTANYVDPFHPNAILLSGDGNGGVDYMELSGDMNAGCDLLEISGDARYGQ